MIPYFGKHSAKQFIRGKPIRFGYKLWGVADPDDGWMLHVEPYCGSSTRLPKTRHGQGGNVVLGLLDAIGAQECSEVAFDNLFTSQGLLDDLTVKGMNGTGTLRENRVKKEMRLPTKEAAAKTVGDVK